MDLSLLPALTDQQRAELIALAAAADEVGFEPEQLAALIRAPLPMLAAALNDPALVAEVEAARLKSVLDGSLLKPKALVIIGAGLDRLKEAMDHDELDHAEVADLVSKAQRIIEHRDRMDADRSDKRKLPVVHVHWGPSGLSLDVVKPPLDDADVIDAEPKNERSGDDE